MTYSPLLLVLCLVSSLTFHLNGQFIGTPASKNDIVAFLKHPVDLKCEYTGAEQVKFTGWYQDNLPVDKEKKGHYIVRNKANESILTINIFVRSDAEVMKWSVNYTQAGVDGERSPPECQFGQIRLRPSPQRIETNKVNERIDSNYSSVRRNEDEKLELRCIIEPEQDPADVTRVEWKFSNDDKTYTTVSNNDNGIVIKGDQLNFEAVKETHRGYYRCRLNGIQLTARLRVKDRLAALWPFLGIVGVVLVLVVVILIFEKRQKSNKKTAATDDDEQEQVTDRLMGTTTKSSDNNSKKRTVNA